MACWTAIANLTRHRPLVPRIACGHTTRPCVLGVRLTAHIKQSRRALARQAVGRWHLLLWPTHLCNCDGSCRMCMPSTRRFLNTSWQATRHAQRWRWKLISAPHPITSRPILSTTAWPEKNRLHANQRGGSSGSSLGGSNLGVGLRARRRSSSGIVLRRTPPPRGRARALGAMRQQPATPTTKPK